MRADQLPPDAGLRPSPPVPLPVATAVGVSLVSKTSAGTYGANEQLMLQQAHDSIRILQAALKAAGIATT